MMAAFVLKRKGFTKVAVMAGGIDAWSIHVDPAVPRYES
jgi:rhodanese-related sulfurtransferase